ncbi:heme ABC transporter ATP-binding protein [Thalassobium sp. R2A62]|uniref:heme ABC transporter ATP-binding protein n=1 Tax=Thalassobium sp. R2A62 TaxID=633131 RepID=UPI0001B1CE59|nr:heme ABC transporter ATP-binding protein [Thalassobium sp. R2A62]EET47573.1 hemin import ATP-binding protein HmuV [Thalassobium sp. R2A62]
MLDVRNLSVAISATTILHDVSFSADAGAVTVIVGPNGSGKTTLLKAMTGELPYSGTIKLDGADIKSYSTAALAARRAVLPQATALAFPFTVLEVIRLGLSAGLYADDTNLPKRALAHVGLSGFEGRFYHALSGGEQQRCQLARVLVQVWQPVRDGKPASLFLDEPVSALDIGHQLEVMQIARGFADAGGSVVAVMHDLNLTAMFADSVALLAKGRMVIQDRPANVLSDAHLSAAYRCDVRVNKAPPKSRGIPFILPHMASTTGTKIV